MEADIIKTAIDLMTPVIEGSIVVAAEYAKACGRDVVTSTDVNYGMKYCARYMVGKHIGTMFPEIDPNESDSEEYETDSEGEEDLFTRYDGDDTILKQVNDSVDTWDSWIPSNMTESMLRDAINKNY